MRLAAAARDAHVEAAEAAGEGWVVRLLAGAPPAEHALGADAVLGSGAVAVGVALAAGKGSAAAPKTQPAKRFAIVPAAARLGERRPCDQPKIDGPGPLFLPLLLLGPSSVIHGLVSF